MIYKEIILYRRLDYIITLHFDYSMACFMRKTESKINTSFMFEKLYFEAVLSNI